MGKSKPTCDVFISHNSQDKQFAVEIAEVLRSYDLQVFIDSEIPVGSKIDDAIWDAMAESQALVAVVSAAEPSAWLAIEMGAAKAWNKPMYGIVSEPSLVRVPSAFHDLLLFPRSRIEDVALEIKRSSEPLTKAEIDVLIESFLLKATPVDQLFFQPQSVSEIIEEIQSQTGRRIPSEQVLRTLIRLRKQGQLPRIEKSRPLPHAS
jgi:hypothetical protein